jgi:hypothetical protein
MNPVRASLRYPQVTIALTIMLVASGIYALLRMPRREDSKIHVPIGIVGRGEPRTPSESGMDRCGKGGSEAESGRNWRRSG